MQPPIPPTVEKTSPQITPNETVPVPGSRFTVGLQVGPYRLLNFLGRGAFGEVWLAERDSVIAKNRLAVKLPLVAHLDFAAVRKEAEVWVRAGNHPNILPLFEANVYENQVVIVSEYAPDGSLEHWMKMQGGRSPTVEIAIDMTMAILAGLEHLHIRGIIHRDLKPANVLMQGESPRIADFGLARVIDPDSTITIAGTPQYMAPEAFDGERSVQTDLWSVGVILYQMLGGSLPFPSGQLMKLIKSIGTEPPTPLSESIPKAIRDIVEQALDKNPGRRFRSAIEMRAVLRDSLRNLEPKSDAVKSTLPRGCQAIAVTGSMYADAWRTADRVRALLTPYCGQRTTWYCGTVGKVDEVVAEFLLSRGQRVIAVGYSSGDLSPAMGDLLHQYQAPFVDAMDEKVPSVENPPSQRDSYFASKADLVVLVWDSSSRGTAEILSWLKRVKKDHIVGFI